MRNPHPLVREPDPPLDPARLLKWGDAFAVMASNAGNDRVPASWLNLRAEPTEEVLAERTRHRVRARQADPQEDAAVWAAIAGLNPGFDEYRRLTEQRIPVILLEPAREF